MVRVVSGIAIDRYHRLLMVRKNGVWILPGGKIKKGEYDLERLFREFREELPHAWATVLAEGKIFHGNAPHSKKKISVKTYFVEITNSIDVAQEIEQAKWVKEGDFGNYPMSEVMADVIAHLIFEGKYLSKKKIIQ